MFVIYLGVGLIQVTLVATELAAHGTANGADLLHMAHQCGLRLTLAAFYITAGLDGLLQPGRRPSADEARFSALVHFISAALGLADAAAPLFVGTNMPLEIYACKPGVALFGALLVHSIYEMRVVFKDWPPHGDG